MNTKKLLIGLLGLALVAFIGFGTFPPGDSQGKLSNFKGFTKKAPAVQTPVKAPSQTTGGGAYQPIGDPSITSGFVSSYSFTMNVTPACTYQDEWKFMSNWKLVNAGHDLRLDRLPFKVFKGVTAQSAALDIANNYKVLISSSADYTQSALASIEVNPMPGANGYGSSYVFLAEFPNGVMLNQNTTYYVTLLGKPFNTGPGFNQVKPGAAMLMAYIDNAFLGAYTTLGEFSPGTASAAPAVQGVNVTLGTNLSVSMDERLAYHPDPACRSNTP